MQLCEIFCYTVKFCTKIKKYIISVDAGLIYITWRTKTLGVVAVSQLDAISIDLTTSLQISKKTIPYKALYIISFDNAVKLNLPLHLLL